MNRPSSEPNGAQEAQYAALAVDDEPSVLTALRRLLSRCGFEIMVAGDSTVALDILAARSRQLDLLILDVAMPGMDGLELLARAREIAPDLPVVMLTGDATAETAVRAFHSGAFSYLTKAQLAQPEEVALLLSRAAAYGKLQRHARDLESRINLAEHFEKLVGASEAMRSVYATIDRVATLDVSVLILGESGTGKELVARAIHDRSHRAKGPFVALNCAALPDTLVDSELFGHTRGAFTGAVQARSGAFERANGGTLFLDEIGDISPAVQMRLLRVLQESVVIPVGGEVAKKIDVRVIAATLVDLEEAVQDRSFRPDLFYRLNVVTMDLPPLRNRIDDVPLLIAHFLKKHAERMGRTPPSLSPDAVEVLGSYRWPGNVRELENAIQHALALSPGDVIEAGAFPERVRTNSPPVPMSELMRTDGAMAWTDELSLTDARKQVLERFERSYITRLLVQTRGNISEAARRAGVDRSNLRRTMNRLGIDASNYSRD